MNPNILEFNYDYPLKSLDSMNQDNKILLNY